MRGRLPVVVDVDAFAMQNAFEANYDADPAAVTVLMNMGASAVNINIVSGAASIFTRDVSIGGNAYTEAVQREFNLTWSDTLPPGNRLAAGSRWQRGERGGVTLFPLA